MQKPKLKKHQARKASVTSETRSNASPIHGHGAAGKGKEHDYLGTAAEHGQHHEGSGRHLPEKCKGVRKPTGGHATGRTRSTR